MNKKESRFPEDEKLTSSVRASLMKYAGKRNLNGVVSPWTGLETVDDIFTEVARAMDRLRSICDVSVSREIREGYGYITFKRGDYKGKTIGEYRFTSLLEFCNDEYPEYHHNWTPEGLKVLWHIENSYTAGKGFPKSADPDYPCSKSEPGAAAAGEPSPPGHHGRGKHLRLVKEHTVKTPSITFRTVKGKGSRTDN